MRRRKRRTRSEEGKLTFDRFDSWDIQHSPYTWEGRWEGMARLAYGVHRRRREGRTTYGMRILALVLLSPFAAALVLALIDLFNG